MRIRIMKIDVRKGVVAPGKPAREFLSAFVVDQDDDTRSLSLAVAIDAPLALAIAGAIAAEEAAQAKAETAGVKRGAYVPVFDVTGLTAEASTSTNAAGDAVPVRDQSGRPCFNLRAQAGAMATFVAWEPRSHAIAMANAVPPPPAA